MPFEVVVIRNIVHDVGDLDPVANTTISTHNSFTPQAAPTLVTNKELDGVIADGIADPLGEASTLMLSEFGRYGFEGFADDEDDAIGTMALVIDVLMGIEETMDLSFAVEDLCEADQGAHVSY